MGAISELHSFNTLALRPSDPGALCIFKPFNSLRTPFRVNCNLTHWGERASAFTWDFRIRFASEDRVELLITDVCLINDHDIVNSYPPVKKSKRKVYRYQKCDYESMRNDTLKFAKERYFNCHSDTRSVQENFKVITPFIQDSADKHPLKTSRSVAPVPWITPGIRRKIRKKNGTHAKAKKTAVQIIDPNIQYEFLMTF